MLNGVKMRKQKPPHCSHQPRQVCGKRPVHVVEAVSVNSKKVYLDTNHNTISFIYSGVILGIL